MAAGRLDVLLGLDAAEFTSGLSKAELDAKKFQDSIVRGAKAFSAAFGAAAVAGAVAVGREIAQMVTELDDLDESAQALQTTAVGLAEMRTAAGEAGVSAEKLDTALTRLNVKISEAAQGGNDSARAFQALGVKVTDSTGKIRSTEAVLADVANEFARLREGPAKAALAVELFGKAGAALIPYLNQGADGLRRFSGLTDETVEAAKKIQSEVDKLSASWLAMKYAIAGEVLPALNDFLAKSAELATSGAGASGAGVFSPESLAAQGGAVLSSAQAFDAYSAAVAEAAAKQKQLNEALALGEGAYSNEGRVLLRSADDVLARAKALKEAEEAAKKAAAAAQKHAEALEREAAAIRSSNVRQDFADAARIRANRQRGQEQLDDEDRQTELQRQEQYLKDFAKARSEAFGEDFVTETKKASDAAQQFGLVMTSALGDWIKDPGDYRSFFDALMQDLLQLTTQLLILKPLMEGINATWGDTPASSTGGKQMAGLFGGARDFFSDLFGGFVGSFAVGTDYVPADGLAMIHRGERIVPASENRAGGGRSMTIVNQWPAGTTTETASQAGAAFARKLNVWNTRNN